MMQQKKYRILISGGGTGGHIYPALAIGQELKSQFPDASFLFVGAQGKMEMEIVPKFGFEIKGLWITGIQRKITLKNLLLPFKLASSLIEARKILRNFKPDIVIGTGGYASGAVLKVAQLMNIPTVVQEQNSYPGLTNKWLADKAKVVCTAYPNIQKYFPKANIVETGNPLREGLDYVHTNVDCLASVFHLNPEKKTILVLGGSLGSKVMNEIIAKYIHLFQENDLQLIWQCGKNYYDTYKKYNQSHYGVKVFPFIENMNDAYAAANFIISRAGASTVSELAMVGKPVLFIPSPNVAEDHQTKNAQSVVSLGGAVMVREQDLDNLFELELLKMVKDEQQAKEMALALKKLAKPNATKHIVEEIIKYI